MINTFGKVLLTGSGSRLKLKLSYFEHEFDLDNVVEYLNERAEFLRGSLVEVIWEPGLPPIDVHNRIVQLLEGQFEATAVDSFRKTELFKKQVELHEGSGLKPTDFEFGPDNQFPKVESEAQIPDEREYLSAELLSGFTELSGVQGYSHQIAEVHFGTLRSGQRIESDKSVLLVGDANQGSEIISGGDIFVLGSLRGTAHAGAFEEKPQNTIIFSLSLCPIQLRIGTIISRGDGLQLRKHVQAEIARLDDDQIVVEPYSSKGIVSLLAKPKFRSVESR